MSDLPVVVAALRGAYLSGAVPYGLVVARLRGVDLRATGSGNIGATNAARALGKPLGALVLLLDAAKGFVPALLARQAVGCCLTGQWVTAGVGLAAILGHLFPIWLRGRGGKGVATAAGVFLALAPAAAGLAVAVYAVVLAATRLSALGSLVAATALVGLVPVLGAPRPTVVLGAVAWLLIVWRHRENLARLRQGTEARL